MANKKEDWLETLVKKYSIPTEEKTDKRGILNESQLKNINNQNKERKEEKYISNQRKEENAIQYRAENIIIKSEVKY